MRRPSSRFRPRPTTCRSRPARRSRSSARSSPSAAQPSASEPEAPEEDDTIRPLSDRLVTELTAHRTLALRDGVANDPQVAFQAVLHALCLNAFYRYAASTCLEITAKQSGFSAQAPGLAETASAKAIDARHAQWAKQLPETSGRSLGHADGVRQRQPIGAVRPLRLAHRQRGQGAVEPAAGCSCPWRSARPRRGSRHGRRRLDADRR